MIALFIIYFGRGYVEADREVGSSAGSSAVVIRTVSGSSESEQRDVFSFESFFVTYSTASLPRVCCGIELHSKTKNKFFVSSFLYVV